MHRGVRTTGGNLSSELTKKIDTLFDEFLKHAEEAAQESKLRWAIVRARLACNIVVLVDDLNISLIGQISHGTASGRYFDQAGAKFSLNDLNGIAQFDFGFNDFFIVIFPKELLDETPSTRDETIKQIAKDYVNREIERFNYMTNIIQVSPIFGAAQYRLDNQLVFTLMPFNEKRDAIYNNVIKPVIESDPLNLVCKRADDIKSNKVIMQDIWKSICEARLIIADLSDLNPNVMYELGVAHTVGKDTILLYEKTETIKFPFDLAHIRRIEYTNEISSTKQLEDDLKKTVMSVLSGKTSTT